jgi:hypothetical protein
MKTKLTLLIAAGSTTFVVLPSWICGGFSAQTALIVAINALAASFTTANVIDFLYISRSQVRHDRG